MRRHPLRPSATTCSSAFILAFAPGMACAPSVEVRAGVPHPSVASADVNISPSPPSEVLPFRLQLSPTNRPLPVIEGFSIRFAEPCVSRGSAVSAAPHQPKPPKHPPQTEPIVTHLEAGRVARGHDLRVRLDGHTSRGLGLSLHRETVVPLEYLANPWEGVGPGLHEVVVFARADGGVVPETPDGVTALQVCRFHVGQGGELSLVSSNPSGAFVLLEPEGTHYGPEATAVVVQVAKTGARFGETEARPVQEPALRMAVRRPDGGSETHDVEPGPFVLAPLSAGDYAFALASPETPLESTLPALGYLQWVTINPE